MDFLLEEKKVHLNSISKSFAENYDTCPLKAWKKKRRNRDEENRYLMVGLAAHEFFAAEIAKRLGERYTPRKITDPSVRLEAQNIIKSINFDRLIRKDAQILGYEDKAEEILPNGMSLIGVFDLVLFVDDPVVGEMIQVVDFKTSFVVKKEMDNEAIFYAYLAAKKYELPITFTRFSGRTGDMWGHFFRYDEAVSYVDLIVPYAEEIKEVVESEEEPFPRPGAHCIQCPFLDECVAKEMDISNPRELLAKYRLFEAEAKVLKEKIKDLRIANENPVETPEFVVDLNESRSVAIAEKGLNKKDVLVMLHQAEKLPEIIDSLDFKITEEVRDVLKEMGINTKEVVRRNLVIKENESLINNSEDESEGGSNE